MSTQLFREESGTRKPGEAGSEPEDKPTSDRRLVGRQLSTVQARAIDWLWTGWIPRKYITLIVGESGAGKSTVLADIVARISTGRPWPGEDEHNAAYHRRPSRVMWLGSEDGAEDMTVPRLMACGANLERITEIQGVREGKAHATFSMQDHLEQVQESLEWARNEDDPFAILVIDPITSYLPGRKLRKVDISDTGQIRSILEPWFKVAQKYNLAIASVTHFNKDDTRSMLHRVTGSAVFAQTCRSLCAMVHREDDGPFEKAMVQVKVNLPEHPGGAWRFRTEKVDVGIDKENSKLITATKPTWDAIDDSITPRSLMGGQRGPVGKGDDTGVVFSLWLNQLFRTQADPSGWLPVEVVVAEIAKNNVCTRNWWDKNSGKYMDKWNNTGRWLCRPKAQHETK